MAEKPVSPYAKGFSEKDWPVMLHVNVNTRQGEGTVAWLAFCDTWPPNPEEDRLKVKFSSDSRDRSPEAALKVVETLIKQARNQLTLKQALKS